MKDFKIGIKYFVMFMSILVEFVMYGVFFYLLFQLPLIFKIMGSLTLLPITVFAFISSIELIGATVRKTAYDYALNTLDEYKKQYTKCSREK